MPTPDLIPDTETLKWYHYVASAGLAAFSSVFGAGMASQKFINGFQTRLLATERHREQDRQDIERILTRMEKYINKDDFEKEQSKCQLHLAESMNRIEKTLEQLVRLHLKNGLND